MGAQTAEDWGIQVSIKHGPTDDRGNSQYMTNVRGYTAREVADHLADLGDQGAKIQEGINAFLAVETVKRTFPEAERVRDDRREERREERGSRDERPRDTGKFKDRDGELCRGHDMPRRWKEVKSSKDGKWYELLECTAKSDPCKAIWPDKD